MDRFLELHAGHTTIPDCGTTSLAAFTDENIAFEKPVAILLVVLEGHHLKIRRVHIEPADIRISKIGLKSAFVLLCVEHFSETHFGYLAENDARPSWCRTDRRLHCSMASSSFIPCWISA